MGDVAPPWRCELTAVMWWALRPGTAPQLTVGALVHYTGTPVGPYCEVLAARVSTRHARPSVTVPFLAVDSPASLAAGRAIWALPKTSASFDGSVAEGAFTAQSEAWSVRATPQHLAPAVPALLWARLEQRDGHLCVTAPLAGRGRARVGRVDVEASAGAGLPDWLPLGSRWGARVRGVLTLGAPRPC